MNGQTLRRILVMLTLISKDIEWFAIDMTPEKRKKWLNLYQKRVDWILRDIITSTPHSHVYDDVFAELNSEHIKDLTEWLDTGINCVNINDVLNAIKQSAHDTRQPV